MAHHDAGHVSADEQYGETPPGAGYEHTDAHVWLIVKFLLWLAVSAVVIHFGLGLFYQLLIERAQVVGEQPYPLAAAQEQRLPAAPRLQQFPRTEFEQFRAGEEDLLQNYGWMNRNAGIVHIPIEEAMRLTVERGLPSRAEETASPAEPPGLMPADASSGRTMERRRQ
ncbi:MAG: hypothetical protein HY657_08385 [Acidobacteria bacterium]|nr:hypothetical protein [Acidobacteriota bacterium]